MTEKCKLNDLAKDLGVSNKELIDLIEARFGEQKKATAVLVDQELNYVVEYYSKKGEVKSFDQYFADGEKKRAERLAPKPQSRRSLRRSRLRSRLTPRRSLSPRRLRHRSRQKSLPRSRRRSARLSRTRSIRRSRQLPVRPLPLWIPGVRKRPKRSRCARM